MVEEEVLNKHRLVILAIAVMLFVAGCNEATPMVETSPLTSPQSVVPTPDERTPTEVAMVPFELDKPISGGATEVTGSGPAGIPIMIVDISMGGNVLGTGTVGSDGEFTVELSQALEARHRIGIALGNLSGTGWEVTDLQDDRYYGSEALSVPQVGFFFDTYFIAE